MSTPQQQQPPDPGAVAWQIMQGQSPAGPVVRLQIVSANGIEMAVTMLAGDMARLGADIARAARHAATGLVIPAGVLPARNGHPAG